MKHIIRKNDRISRGNYVSVGCKTILLGNIDVAHYMHEE